MRPPAPGHGFPLIKRKVQADQYIPEEDIYGEMDNIERQLDALEHSGVLLEEKLRGGAHEGSEDDMLVDWFKLIHEKHLLVRRESELIYVFKQQSLEQRQADVEYELRCLLNKPEKDWTDEDRARETVLMQELKTLVEQRDAIVNCLDEDRQRCHAQDPVGEQLPAEPGGVLALMLAQSLGCGRDPQMARSLSAVDTQLLFFDPGKKRKIRCWKL